MNETQAEMLWWAGEMDDGYLGSSANTLVCTWMQLFPIIFSNYFFTLATVQRGMKTTKHLCEIWMQVFQKCFFSVYPILLWVNKHQRNHVGGLLVGGFIFFHEFKYQMENLKEEVIPFFRVLVFGFFFSGLFGFFHAWNHILWLRVLEPGRIFWENIPLWSAILDTLMTRGVVLHGCYKQLSPTPVCQEWLLSTFGHGWRQDAWLWGSLVWHIITVILLRHFFFFNI